MFMRRCLWVCLLALVILAVVAANAEVPAWGQDSTLIVPGVGVGAIRFGMTAGQVYGILGDPCIQDRRKNPAMYGWDCSINGGAVLLIFIGNWGVERIDIWNAGYATKEGVRVGMSEMGVEALIGPPTKVLVNNAGTRFLLFNKLGLSLRVETDGRVSILTVVPPR